MNRPSLIVLLATGVLFASTAAASAESPVYESLLKLCTKIKNSERCAYAIENSYAGRNESRYFKRTGPTLKVTTPRKSFELRNNENPDGDVSYHYLAYLARNGIHVIHMQYGEGNDFAVIGDQDQHKHVVSGFPIVSPDDTRFFSYNAAGEAQYTPDALEIWRIESGTLVREFSSTPNFSNCQILSARWLSKSQILLTGKASKDAPAKVACSFRFTQVSGRWRQQ